MISILLGLTSVSAFGQALISNPIQGIRSEPPGLVYSDGQQTVTNLDFRIDFKLDSTKMSQSATSYGCFNWTPNGFWLYDRHPNTGYGRWMITLSRAGQLCFKDMPDQGTNTLEFQNIDADVCHSLTATHSSGALVITLDGVSQSISTGIESPTYRSGPNGIGVGREVNGYHDRWGNDSFPGDIYYLNDNGRILAFDDPGQITGNASLGLSSCEGGIQPPPPPPPPPAPTECEIDPYSVHCACETNPHPACDVCLID